MSMIVIRNSATTTNTVGVSGEGIGGSEIVIEIDLQKFGNLLEIFFPLRSLMEI